MGIDFIAANIRHALRESPIIKPLLDPHSPKYSIATGGRTVNSLSLGHSFDDKHEAIEVIIRQWARCGLKSSLVISAPPPALSLFLHEHRRRLSAAWHRRRPHHDTFINVAARNRLNYVFGARREFTGMPRLYLLECARRLRLIEAGRCVRRSHWRSGVMPTMPAPKPPSWAPINEPYFLDARPQRYHSSPIHEIWEGDENHYAR